MNRPLLIGLIAAILAWLLARRSAPAGSLVPVEQAAAKLQQAWADHRTRA